MVEANIEQFAMHEEDLGNHSIADVACISCRPLCTSKIIRRYNKEKAEQMIFNGLSDKGKRKWAKIPLIYD